MCTAPVCEGRGGFGIVRHMSLRASAVGCLSGSLPVASSAALVACNGGLVFCPPVCPGNNLCALLGLLKNLSQGRFLLVLPFRLPPHHGVKTHRNGQYEHAKRGLQGTYHRTRTFGNNNQSTASTPQRIKRAPLVSLQHLHWEFAFKDSQSAEGHSWLLAYVLYPCSISYSLRSGACTMGPVQPLPPQTCIGATL